MTSYIPASFSLVSLRKSATAFLRRAHRAGALRRRPATRQTRVQMMVQRLRFCLPLLAWLTRAYGLGIPLSSRQPGQFTEFQGRRVGFGSVKEVRVPLAGATIPELQEYLTPERVATAMWDRDKVKSVGDGCYELRMEKLSFVMLDIDSSVRVHVETKADVAGQRGPTG